MRQALAHAGDLVPATVLAARLLSRKGEIRKAAKLIEAAWPRYRHPELAEAYLDLRPGDSNADRLAKAQSLAKRAPHDPESHMIVARAALAARAYATARKAMAPLVAEGERLSVRACLIMAELEDAEFGDQGQVREWLARSARAPRDPMWMADGVAAKQWAPVSPVTGRLDAFVWQRPAERLGADLEALEWTKHWSLPSQPAAAPDEKPVVDAVAIAAPAPENPAQEKDVAAPSSAPSEMAPQTQAPSSEGQRAPSSEGQRAPRAQKVVFPMAGPPDDPGPDEPSEPEIHRVGFL